MDLNSLRIQVFEKTGIRIDTSDPVFALVALNEAVLSECVERHTAALQGATVRLTQQTDQLIEAGERTRKMLLQLGQAVEQPASAEAMPTMQASAAPPESGLPWRWIAATGGASILSAMLVLLGQAALGYPRAAVPVSSPPARLATSLVAPAASAAAPALTGEQIQLIQNGEKYARMWPKLDPKTQERIKALSQ